MATESVIHTGADQQSLYLQSKSLHPWKNRSARRLVDPVDLSRLSFQLPDAANWQTIIDMFRQRTTLAFSPKPADLVCIDNRHPARYEDQDVERFFISRWIDPEPYDHTSVFVQYILQFRYTPIHLRTRNFEFFEQSLLLMDSLFLSSNLPALQVEVLEEESCRTVLRVSMGCTTNWIPSVKSKKFRSRKAYLADPQNRNFTLHAKCFAVIIVAKENHIDWELINSTQKDSFPAFERGEGLGLTKALILRLRHECCQHQCAYGMLSDGATFASFQYTPDPDPDAFSHRHIILQPFDSATFSCVQALTFMIFDEAYRSGLCRDDLPDLNSAALSYQGALHQSPVPCSVDSTSVSSFDVYRMHYDRSYFEAFLDWKTRIEKQAEAQPLRVGDVLDVTVDAVFRRFARWRSPFPSTPIPEETREVVMRAPRPRFTDLDAFLSSNTANSVHFTITSLVRVGSGKFSQVVFGKFNEMPQYELALKLMDERLILLPPTTAFDESTKGDAERLRGVETAEDMLRREEGVYEDKLKYLQGTMIPHCYGFHTFILPDGWRAHGMLLEIIKGPGFHELDIKARDRSYRPSHIDMVLRARHVTRALRYAGIDQTDWHGGQILCPSSKGEQDTKETFDHELVLIDFAFAEQRLGESVGCPAMRNNFGLLGVMVHDTDLNFYQGDEGRTFHEKWNDPDFPEEC